MKNSNSFASPQEETISGRSIKILPRQEINTDLWDACIMESENESPLAYSWVLDFLAPGWHGLIIGYYEGVMPLPTIKQLGYFIIQMPQEVITLGIFSPNSHLTELFPAIFNHNIFSPFRFINYNGSPSTRRTSTGSGCTQKRTFELNLENDYQTLYQQYSRTHKRNIKAFYDSGLNIEKTSSPKVFTSLIKEIGAFRPELYMLPDYQKKFEMMTNYALENRIGETYSVRKNNKLIGGAFFLIGKKRIIPYHLANPDGRVYKTSFALIDQFIKQYSGQKKILDFAGSVFPNVATFNRRFGAKEVPYYAVRINRLPQPIKWAKDKNLLFNLKRLIFK
ncbi:hypothetical protein [Marinilabilia sp.]|uniref:hypothetical protein n=1 Tax=Marinilabilia sp. TaxID=2021252 RepID=UPI0025C383A7|nr:hypothetical protein [Marinilabilia sp.]